VFTNPLVLLNFPAGQGPIIFKYARLVRNMLGVDRGKNKTIYQSKNDT
jgi:hypothetical protein